MDTLCESSLQTYNTDRAQGRPAANGTYYVPYISRDLDKVVDYVVPDSKDGLMNVQSTTQVRQASIIDDKLIISGKILENWRIKRIIDVSNVDSAVSLLDRRKERLAPDS